jgi:hypothetical protein
MHAYQAFLQQQQQQQYSGQGYRHHAGNAYYAGDGQPPPGSAASATGGWMADNRDVIAGATYLAGSSNVVPYDEHADDADADVDGRMHSDDGAGDDDERHAEGKRISWSDEHGFDLCMVRVLSLPFLACAASPV